MLTRIKENPIVLLQCAALQLLDVVTTLLFLAHGVEEANPLVRWSISLANGRLAGLLAVKCLACLLAITAVQSGRVWAVVKMNRFFLFLAAWNIMALGLSFLR